MSDSDRDRLAWRQTPSAYLAARPAGRPGQPAEVALCRDAGRLPPGGGHLPAAGCTKAGAGDADPDALLPAVRAEAGAPPRPSHALPAAGATCSCRAAMRWSLRRARHRRQLRHARQLPLAARARGLPRDRRMGRARSRGRTARSGRPASPMSARPAISSRAGPPRGEARSRRCRRCGTPTSDHYYPGGLLLNRLAETYDELMVALDHDRRDLLGEVRIFQGSEPRRAAAGRRRCRRQLARAAVAEHQGNFRMTEFIAEFRFKRRRAGLRPGSHAGVLQSRMATAHRRRPRCRGLFGLRAGIDGAGYVDGAIARFLTLPNRKRHLLLGPWDHGARVNGSPWRRSRRPEFPLHGEVLRFFDHYLMGLATGLERNRRCIISRCTAKVSRRDHGLLQPTRDACFWPKAQPCRCHRDRARTKVRQPISASAAGHTPVMAGCTRTTRVPITTTRRHGGWATLATARSLDGDIELRRADAAACRPPSRMGALLVFLSEEEPNGHCALRDRGGACCGRCIASMRAPPPDYRASWPCPQLRSRRRGAAGAWPTRTWSWRCCRPPDISASAAASD